MHADMWAARLRETEEGRRRFESAVDELWPYALGVLPTDQHEALAARARLELPSDNLLRGKERGAVTGDLAPLWEEMTIVRRSVPAGAQW